jgi:16S rRNA processing protein RimM
LLEIEGAGRKQALLLPFTLAVVPTVDLAAGRIVVDLPEGLD